MTKNEKDALANLLGHADLAGLRVALVRDTIEEGTARRKLTDAARSIETIKSVLQVMAFAPTCAVCGPQGAPGQIAYANGELAPCTNPGCPSGVAR